MYTTFEEVKAAVKNAGFHIITEGKTYFNVEDAEGYRAYMQMDSLGMTSDMKYARGFSFSTVHKPNKNSGSGRCTITIGCDSDITAIAHSLHETLATSKRNILSGREKMDHRKPNPSGEFLR